MAMRIKLYDDAFENVDAMAQAYIEEDVLPTIVKRAKRIVPTDTHKLQESIHAETGPDGNFVVADTEYAEFVERGTSKMAAQPYLRPAMSTKLPRKSKGK